MFEKASLNNVGAAWSLAAGDTATADPSRSLVKFAPDSALPPNVIITSARLELTVVRTIVFVPTTFETHRLLVNWGEGDKGGGLVSGVGTAATTGEASWMTRLHPTTFWSEPGGGAGEDYVAEPSAAGDLASESLLSFESTPESVADVQAWLDSPAGNFGWLIKAATESGEVSARRFGSREHPDSPPRLHLEYETAGFRIKRAERQGGNLCLHFTASAGKAYVVERRDQVDMGIWTIITNLSPATVTEDVVICEPLGLEHRFYRVGER